MLAGALACDRPAPAATGPVVSQSDPVVLAAADPGRGVPLTITIEGPSVIASDEIDVRAIVERRTPAPFVLAVRLPRSVRLVGGVSNERIHGPERRLERTFRLRLLNGIPSQSVRVVARAGGRAQGVRASAEYRFGGAEPILEQPERPGPRLRVQGHDLGSAIPLR
jgi:hypothetical protein